MSEDQRLLSSLLEGDSEGIEDIYRLVFPRVKMFVLGNHGEEEDAWDIFQKALMQLTARIRKRQFQITDSFEAYLYTACKNLWRRELNRRKRVTTMHRNEQHGENASEDMAIAILEQERWELLQRCIQKLSENCRRILTMYFRDTSYAAMKNEFNYNSETVARQRVFKCKAKLVKTIKESPDYKNLQDL